jgi:hypothetical protein
MTAGEAMIGSWEFTLSKGGVTADEAAVGSCRRAPFGGRLTVDEVTAGPSREDQHPAWQRLAPADLKG